MRFFYDRVRKYLWTVPVMSGLAIWHSWGKSPATILSDMLFMSGMCLVLCGLWKLVNNLGLFHSVRYGSKVFLQVILEHTSFAERLPRSGDYLSYLREFVPDDSYPAPLLLGGVMLAAALLLCFL